MTILVFLAFFARIWALNSNMFICFAISFVGIFSAIVTPVSAFCKGKKMTITVILATTFIVPYINSDVIVSSA